ncbi:helix-turn-helix domain-containing protein [Streptomyces sp. NPDC049040]|uniref:helix-turn-helix domain-containing protein n=1 Tax=Streptomyces sp. NPDC049040 TaxID=3365593 RepID=UPI003718FC59
MSEPRPGPTVGQLVLGKRLLDLREKAGLSREDAARVIRVAQATVHRMETAKVALKVVYVERLLAAYGIAPPEVAAFVELVEEANRPGWWQRFHDILPDWFSAYVALEAAASLIRVFEPAFVPGLLQTTAYARTVMETGPLGRTSPDEVERHVALRMERQALLTRPGAPRFWAVLDETVLRRHVGSAEVMREQIDHLLEVSRRRNVTLQIAEFSAGHHSGAHGPVALFRFDEGELPDMVYVEYLTGALYIDERNEVASHHAVLDEIAAQAATARRTKEILQGLREEL